jgi:hypothetical protein
MDKNVLERLYRTASATASYTEHQKFIEELLADNDPSTIDYHFGLLRNHENWSLYLDVRAAFEKRGERAADYLSERIQTETDGDLKADALLLLGLMRSPDALLFARQLLNAPNPSLREKACCVLGNLCTSLQAA